MMNLPTFSIIIPTYNRADFIVRTIKSVLAQEYRDFEILVVDDGSTDDTKNRISDIEDGRIKYLYKNNQERGAARNYGAKHAKGNYLTFLDSDDIVYPNHLNEALEMIKRHSNPEWFYLAYEIVSPELKSIKRIDDYPEIANKRMIKGNVLSCNGVFIRADIATSFPFNPDRKLAGTEDYQLWLRLASRYPLYCSNAVTSALVEHSGRSVVNTNRQRLIDRVMLLETSLLEDEEFLRFIGKSLHFFKANNRSYIALHLALAKNDRIGTLLYLAKAIKCSPKVFRTRMFYGALKRIFL